nr:glucose-6-phosphate isomerase [Kiloniellales bacterium]
RLGDLFAAAGRATAETLVAERRPVRRLHLSKLDEESLGALFMHFMLETIFAADLLGVEPFDQPAVEAGKRLTRQYLEEGGEEAAG